MDIFHSATACPGPDALFRRVGRAVAECLGLDGLHVHIHRGAWAGYCMPGNGGRMPGHWLCATLEFQGREAGVVAAGALKDPDGRERVDESGDMEWFMAVARYISLALEQAGDHCRQAIDLPLGMALVEDRRFKWVNREMVRMFGFHGEEALIGQSVKMIYGTAEAFELSGKTVFQDISLEGCGDYELELVRRDGSRLPVHVQLNTPGEEDRGVLAVFTDMSRCRTHGQENIEAERLQGALEMAGAVRHEMTRPLQAITRYAELLMSDPESEVWEKGMAVIEAQAGCLGKVTAGLANITRYKTRPGPGRNRVVDIWRAGPPEMKFKAK